MSRSPIFLFMCAAAALHCGGTPASDDANNAPDAAASSSQRDMLVFGAGSDLDSLLPPVSQSASDSMVEANIYMPLMDAEFDCSLKKTKDGLVQSWEWNEEGTKLTFKMRDDIKWADGTPVTTADVKFAYDMIGNSKVASPRLSFLDKMTEDGRPKVIDDYTLEWHFTAAYDRDTQASHASLGYVPAHILKSVDMATVRGSKENKAPLASGPFKLIDHKPGQSFALVPNDKFTGKPEEAARLKRIQVNIVPEYQTRLLKLKKGEIDLAEGIQVKDADELVRSNPNIKLMRRGYRFNDYIAWNLKNDLFKDKNVRQALAHSVDIEWMIGRILTSESGEKFGRPSVGTITPELCNVHNDDIKPYPFDEAIAREKFAAAGWSDTNGDGLLDKDGKNFQFTLMTNRENERRMEAAILIQNALKKVGVEMTIDTKEFNTMTDLMRKKKFEAVLGGWSAGLFVDPSSIWHSSTEEKKYPFNYTSYSNPEVDELIAQGMSTPDPTVAAPIWKDMQAKIYEDQPYLFLWWREEIVGIDSRFENVQMNVLNLLFDLHEWEVPPEKVKYKL